MTSASGGGDDDATERSVFATPGSAQWATRLSELRDVEPSSRRAELHRVADAVRGVLHRLVQTSAPIELLSEVAADLEEAVEHLSRHDRAPGYEGFSESANAGDPLAFFDHSPMLGRANPLAPPLELWLEEGGVRGRVRFGAGYEGPPGCVHGGFLAAAFDEVLGSTQSLSGTPGMTARLTVNYRSPTPLLTELQIEGTLDRVDGRKIYTSGRLWAGDTLCAEAEGLFISIDFATFTTLRARREELQRQPDA